MMCWVDRRAVAHVWVAAEATKEEKATPGDCREGRTRMVPPGLRGQGESTGALRRGQE